MRQEEIDRLPDSIPWSVVQEMLTSLGLVPKDVMAVHMYPQNIEVEILARNEKGRPFLDESRDVAKHLIAIKVDYEQ